MHLCCNINKIMFYCDIQRGRASTTAPGSTEISTDQNWYSRAGERKCSGCNKVKMVKYNNYNYI